MTTETTYKTMTLVNQLPTISLEELVNQAAMMTRVDRKYTVSRTQAPDIFAELSEQTRVLQIEGTPKQSYRSVYFDTSDLMSYRTNAYSRRRRFKIRTRIYSDTNCAFLEIKTKGARKTTVKHRIPMDVSAARGNELSNGDKAWLRNQLSGIDQDPAFVGDLKPVLCSEYRRVTLYMEQGGRATIDTDLSWALPSGESIECPDLMIVETKSGSRPSQIDHVLWEYGNRPARFSKFGAAMATLNPDLPSNHWARALRRNDFAAVNTVDSQTNRQIQRRSNR